MDWGYNMKCPKCGLRTTRALRGNKSAENTTKIETVEIWACTNQSCDLYAGPDLSNPAHVANRTSNVEDSVAYQEVDMNDIIVNGQVVEKIEFVDTTDGNKVLGSMDCIACQVCDNGYQFVVTYKESIVKD